MWHAFPPQADNHVFMNRKGADWDVCRPRFMLTLVKSLIYFVIIEKLVEGSSMKGILLIISAAVITISCGQNIGMGEGAGVTGGGFDGYGTIGNQQLYDPRLFGVWTPLPMSSLPQANYFYPDGSFEYRLYDLHSPPNLLESYSGTYSTRQRRVIDIHYADNHIHGNYEIIEDSRPGYQDRLIINTADGLQEYLKANII